MFNATDLVMLTLRRPLVPAANEPGYSFYYDRHGRVHDRRLLPTLAAALHVSTEIAGQLVTVFSLVY